MKPAIASGMAPPMKFNTSPPCRAASGPAPAVSPYKTVAPSPSGISTAPGKAFGTLYNGGIIFVRTTMKALKIAGIVLGAAALIAAAAIAYVASRFDAEHIKSELGRIVQ